MNYTLFLGCNIPARVPQYRDAALAVLKKLGIGFEGREDFMCCGYPMRNMDEGVYLLSAARNLALAEQKKQDLLVLCKCCYGSLKMAEFHLKQNRNLLDKINGMLEKEGLIFRGSLEIKHLLSVLHGDVGLRAIKSRVKLKYQKLKIAASVGCHALRPAGVTRFDSPVSPVIFDDLVNLTGAKSLEWSKKSDCCGAPLLGINDDLSRQIMETKLASAREAGAHFISVACPYSFLQFDVLQSRLAKESETFIPLGPVLYPQLLGLSLGLDAETMGMGHHQVPVMSLKSYLVKEK